MAPSSIWIFGQAEGLLEALDNNGICPSTETLLCPSIFLKGILLIHEISAILLKENKMERGDRMMYEKEIKSKIQRLSEELKREVLDYIDFLLRKYKNKRTPAKKFQFDWEGGLSEIKDRFTSVE